MITNADLPNELNLATWFVDRNVEEGRGDRAALIGPTGPTSYGELAGLVNRCGNLFRELGVRAQDRILLVLADSVEFVALWYGAQKMGAVTAEAYTFLQPKDYGYYLEYTDAAVVVADETTETAIREVAGDRQVLVVDEAFEERLAEHGGELVLQPLPVAGSLRGREALERGGGDALHEDRAQQLQGGRVARPLRDDLDRHAERDEQVGEHACPVTGRQRRRTEPTHGNRSEQRDVRKTCARLRDERGQLALELG